MRLCAHGKYRNIKEGPCSVRAMCHDEVTFDWMVLMCKTVKSCKIYPTVGCKNPGIYSGITLGGNQVCGEIWGHLFHIVHGV